MAKTPESDEQKKVIQWMKYHEEDTPALRTLYHPAGSYFGMGFGVIRWLQLLGVRKGVWDLHLPLDNGAWSGLWIEMKGPKGKLTKEQIAFRDNIQQSTYKSSLFVVCVTAEDAIKAIKEYLRTGESL